MSAESYVTVVTEQRTVTVDGDRTSVVVAEEVHDIPVEYVERSVVVVDERDLVLSEVERVVLVFAGEQGPPGPPGASTGEEMPYAERTDFVGDDVIYRGYAEPGTLDSAPLWRIKKLILAVDGDVTTQWAEGTADFDKVWADHLTLNYV